ncbi:TBC1 domain family member 20 [Heterocephalus glaber]|uniref:TBC1 domain family member 20 n=1 Tax=Heterocephalus glaber TaxID=10181 RepID=G5C6M3_HETGA|nr:TBC1 domain family member 20 [Heterocephalus glaber]
MALRCEQGDGPTCSPWDGGTQKTGTEAGRNPGEQPARTAWGPGGEEQDFNTKRKKKVAEIYQALNSDPTDVAALRRMAISEGGLLTDEIRQKVWPKLLNVNTSDPSPAPGKDLRQVSKDYQQVLLDVRRSLRRFPPGRCCLLASHKPVISLKEHMSTLTIDTEEIANVQGSEVQWDVTQWLLLCRCLRSPGQHAGQYMEHYKTLSSQCMPDEQREGLQEELIDIILLILERNPQLHYYQGYHDIVVTFLLVVGEKLATSLVEKLSTHHLRDFMDSTMDNTKHILNYLMPIIDQVNPELHDFMQSAEVGTIFALSWLITWFGHVLSDFKHVVRLYDFFLACHPLMPIYFAAVIVLYREQEVLDCDCDMASVHHLLSQIPQDLPYETLISRAGDLFVQFPPSELTREAAAQQQAERTAASTFKDFELASAQQRPDMVLRQRFRGLLRPEARTKDVLTKPRTNRFVKLAVMGLTVALGAAALAVVKSALEWAPKFQLQLFP